MPSAWTVAPSKTQQMVMTAYKLPTAAARKILAAAFAAICLILVGGGYGYYRTEAEDIRRSSYENLATIAKMKADRILQWQEERLMDAKRTASGPVLRREAVEIINHTDTPGVREEIEEILDVARKGGLYTSAYLVSRDGKILLATKGSDGSPFSATTQKTLAAIFAGSDRLLSNLFHEANSHIHIDAVAAVRDGGGKPICALILRCNAEDYLYPLIQSWPTSSRSAETLLVQREGEDVIFLNQARHRPNTALSFRLPLTQADAPAVHAVMGRGGIFDGKDYRGKKVLADLRAIPGTPWFMVAKVDQDEILAEARYRATSTSIIVGALILLAAASTAFGYKQQQAGLLRGILEAERQQRDSQEQFRTILYSIGDAVITTDTTGRVQTLNPVAERLTGWTEAEASGKPLDEVFQIINQDTRATVANPVNTVLQSSAVVSLANHTLLIARDGTERAIADSAAPIRDESGAMTGVVLVISDVTEQYRVRAALRRSEREYRMLFEGMLEGCAVHEIICDEAGQPVDYRFLSMNPAFERLTGLRAQDIIGRTVKEALPKTETLWIERYGRVALTGKPIQFEQFTEGLNQYFRVSAFRPQENQFAVVFKDITERKAAEARIARLSHLYAALSQCNQAIVHSASVEELLPQICRSVVQHGGMKMAWIGLVDEATGRVHPAASYGSGTDYLEGIQISVNGDEPLGRGPTGTSIRENKPVWCQDFQQDPSTVAWHERAARYGWGGAASLPLCLRGKTIGAFVIYSDKLEAFDEEVRKLLEEMTSDISFALELFASRAEHKQAEEALKQSEAKAVHFNELLRAMHEIQHLIRSEQDEGSLFNAVCNVLVETRGYLGVWIGVPNFSTHRVMSLAQAGSAKQITREAPITWDDTPNGQGPCGTAIRERAPVIINDIATDPRFEPWREQAMAAGCGSVASIPMAHNEQLFGIITFKANRKDAFNQEEIELLSSLANEVAQATQNIKHQRELKRTEQALRLQSGALEAVANAIVITDSHGVIEWVNTAFTVFTGYTAAEAIGKTPSLLQSSKQDDAFYQNLWNTVLAGEVWHGEIINRRKNGTLYAEEMTITPMRDGQGKITHFIAVKQDITERKQIEENLLRTQRMESLGTLAAGVAHDLNNILTPIILSADMLRAAEQADARECFIATIEKCAQRGANVVNQVLTFARGAKGERTSLQLHRLVSDVEKMMHETFPKNIAITTSVPTELWQIKGDPTQIHQVLLNLCINARDAMPEGGRLLISAQNEAIDEHFASTIVDAKAGDYVVLAIADSGTGIQPKILGQIFDPFFTTKEVGKGTGLGLSTVMGIVRSYGGFVSVESEENRGSTFKIFLPAELGDMEEQKHSTSVEMPQGNGETILVVDDEVFVAKVTTMVLEKNGYKVLAACDGNDALNLYKQHASEIKMVLTDIMMPGMDGVHFARALKAINPRVKIIASTGQATETRQVELRSLGVHIILSKPFDAKKLLSTLHHAIRSRNA